MNPGGNRGGWIAVRLMPDPAAKTSRENVNNLNGTSLWSYVVSTHLRVTARYDESSNSLVTHGCFGGDFDRRSRRDLAVHDRRSLSEYEKISGYSRASYSVISDDCGKKNRTPRVISKYECYQSDSRSEAKRSAIVDQALKTARRHRSVG